MLLETLDIKKNDIVIYSQNLFNQDKNFRIVYKDDVNKESHSISYSEVCRYVNEYTPKNLIVYRLLTNIKDFEFYVSKYGFLLNINGITEMIFFDPVYAVREMEEYSQNVDYIKLRFRIQQVGLTTLNRKGDLPNYAEIYSIDLEATEAKFQNDKVFADAIFSTSKILKTRDKNPAYINKLKEKGPVKEIEKPFETINKPQKYDGNIKTVIPEEKLIKNNAPGKRTTGNDDSNETKPAEIPKQEKIPVEKRHSVVKIEQDIKPLRKEVILDKEVITLPDKEIKHSDRHKPNINTSGPKVEGIRIVSHDISEDKNFDYKEIMKINFKGSAGLEDKKFNPDSSTNRKNISRGNEIKAPADKPIEKTQSLFGKFLKDSKSKKADDKIIRQPGDENVSGVLNMFKSSSSSNEYVKDRTNKQIVLKLDNK